MPVNPISPEVQRVAILKQLSRPSAMPEVGDEQLPTIEDTPPVQAVAAAPAKKGPSAWAKLLYGAGVGADMGSTGYAISKGLHEGNPLVGFAGDKMAVPIGTAEALGTYWLLKQAIGDDHPKIMNAMLAASGGIHGLAAKHNINLINKVKK